mmetsp:Transcript_13209/g.13687  ORF Transcript_13209/g.13687 Transcript_13209/m.13687 type:complete len:387 (-) Transcript_13209:268-1428(-)
MFQSIYLLLFLISYIYGGVVYLNDDNFHSIVNGNTNVMVNFYAPWCQHCHVVAPHYRLLGDTFQEGDDIIIAEIDSPSNPKISAQYIVKTYPTILFFPKGTNDPIFYDNDKSIQPMTDFINNRLGLDRKFPLPQSSVVDLDKRNFANFINDRSTASVVLVFSRGDCPVGNCMSQIGKLETLAEIYKPDSRIKFGRLEGAVAPRIVVHYGAFNYPTYLYFHAYTDEGYTEENPAPEKLEGNPDLEELTKFVNEHSGLHRTENGTLHETAGLIKEVNELIHKVDIIDSNFLTELKNIIKQTQEKYEKEEIFHSDEMKLGEKFYVSYAEKIIERGWQYIHYEIDRIEKLLDPVKRVAGYKKTELMLKLNVCKAYLTNFRQTYEIMDRGL